MHSPGLWLRWSLRDLRSRWLQVAAIALIIALGSGLYSGLASMSRWRRQSYDASFEKLHMYDLRLTLASGATASQGSLASAVWSIPHARSLRAVEERLTGATQVDASRGSETILVPGQLVGVDVSRGGPAVSSLERTAGRSLAAGDGGRPVGVVDTHFAAYHHLPVPQRVRLSGGPLLLVGRALSPEQFIVFGAQNDPLAEANYAVVYTSLATAQMQLGKPGAVDELVVALKPGSDVSVVSAEIRSAMAARLPGVGVELATKSANRVYRQLYDDIGSDQRLYTVFALLVLAGAAFAALNLVARIVTAQRREIGIGMSLGAPGRVLAARPLLIGAEIAVTGAVFGVGVGLLVDVLLGNLLRRYLPLPVWHTGFQPETFALGATLGFVLPFVATIYPVWRAMRSRPVEAIRTGPYTPGSGRSASLLGHVPFPGNTIWQMPFRNTLRSPRRSGLTVLALAASLMILIGALGMVDSFLATIDRAHAEVTRASPRRLSVNMDYTLAGDPRVAAVAHSPTVARSSLGLELGGSLRRGRTRVDVFVSLLDMEHGIWRPSVEKGSLPVGEEPAILITSKAAHDLHVEPGDTIMFRHPLVRGLGRVDFADSPVEVAGISPLPSRFTTFMDLRQGKLFGLPGVVNLVEVEPKAGVAVDQAKRALFTMPGVVSVQPVSAFTDTVRNALSQRLGLMRIIDAVVLALALLIAFNTASLNLDERRREQATMFAFGVPVRTVLATAITESVLLGMLAVALGVGLGWMLLGWLVNTLMAASLPDFGITTTLSPATIATAFALGAVAIVVAPALMLRRLRRMDVPATLRVVE